MQVSVTFSKQKTDRVITMTLERSKQGFYFRLFNGANKLDDRVCDAFAFLSDDDAKVLGAMLAVGGEKI